VTSRFVNSKDILLEKARMTYLLERTNLTLFASISVAANCTQVGRGGLHRASPRVRGNQKAKRHIRCMKHIRSQTVQNPSSRADGIDSVRIENDASIFTPVKSSVTPKEQQDSSFPHCAAKPERIM